VKLRPTTGQINDIVRVLKETRSVPARGDLIDLWEQELGAQKKADAAGLIPATTKRGRAKPAWAVSRLHVGAIKKITPDQVIASITTPEQKAKVAEEAEWMIDFYTGLQAKLSAQTPA